MTHGPWREVVLENDALRCVLLPDKGGEIVSVNYRPLDVELLARLRPTPPNDGHFGLPQAGTSEAEFNRWYAGGWQELLPNGDGPCCVDGIDHSFHGESWARRWLVTSQSATAVTTIVTLQWPPLVLERTLTLVESEAKIAITESVTNTGSKAVRMLWGHHPAFGAPFVGVGARIIAPCAKLETIVCDSTSRLAACSNLIWPSAVGLGGDEIDASVVCGADSRSHDLCLLSEFDTGIVGIENPTLGVTATLEFDPALFRWLWIWQLYGAADDARFDGGYCLAIEPWTGPPTLTRAIELGCAIDLQPNESKTTSLLFAITPFEGTNT